MAISHQSDAASAKWNPDVMAVARARQAQVTQHLR